MDVLVFGGGVAGLWTLDHLRRRGYDAVLVESQALGEGQTIQAQGIVHGGGKYALRGVADLAAVRAIREMPARWTRHLRGDAEPDLSAARLLSSRCHLWVPRRPWRARLQGWGMLPLITHAGLLATRPVRVPRGQWPAALAHHAASVYAMGEPVVDTRSVLAALAERNRGSIFAIDAGADDVGVEVEVKPETGSRRWRCIQLVRRDGGQRVSLAPRAVVLCAGAGNEALLHRGGIEQAAMQRRPLRMILLRGDLPELFAHCVVGGKTRLTVTSAELASGERVWQLGGELAERGAEETEDQRILARAREEIDRWLPDLPRRGLQLAHYLAVRAEARRVDHRRPSGVHVHRVAENVVVGWPTKMALAPLLAEEIHREIGVIVPRPAPTPATPRWPGWSGPEVASYPWETVEWSPAY